MHIGWKLIGIPGAAPWLEGHLWSMRVCVGGGGAQEGEGGWGKENSCSRLPALGAGSGAGSNAGGPGLAEWLVGQDWVRRARHSLDPTSLGPSPPG